MRRRALGLLLLALIPGAAWGAEAKRVLLVHSFGSTAPPFTTHSTAFQTTLTKEMGERVDMDEVSLDMARYAQPDMEGPFVEFLLARLAKWQPDLVVPIGSPAGRFVVKYRHRLFASSKPLVQQAGLIVQLGSNLVKRRRVEQALRESEERFRTVADSAPVLIWMAGVDKRCTFFNRPWLDFTGRTLAQETGTRGSTACTPTTSKPI